MSKLDNLLKKFCPQGVDYKPLEESCNFQNGYGFKSNLFKSEGIPLLTITNIRDNYISEEDLKFVDVNDYNINLEQFYVKKDNIVIAMSGATTGKIGINKTKYNFLLNQRVGLFLPNETVLNNKFLYYFLLTQTNYFYNSAGGGAQPNLSTKVIQKLLIPIPPLEIQNEIVYILDKIAELNLNLTEELIARKKQYEYYQTKLLSMDSNISFKKLKEVSIYSKERINANEVNEDTYIGVDNLIQNKQGKTKATYLPITGRLTKFVPNNILIGNIRPYLRKIWFSNTVGGTNGDVLVIQPITEYINPRYLYAILSSEDFFIYNIQNSKGAKMPRGDKQAIMNYSIPLPTLDKQQQIVEILDKFDFYCNNYEYGLPAEIRLRKKQFEYYLNKLLSFNKKE